MRIPAVSIFLMLFFASCKKSDFNSFPTFPRVDSIKGYYLFNTEQHAGEFYIGAVTEGWSTFEFENNKLTRRIGGTIGFFGGSNDNIVDTVVYNSTGDTITLSTINRDPFYNIPANPRIIVLNDGLVVKKITYNTRPGNEGSDTINYYYDNARTLNRTVQQIGGGVHERLYEYDTRGNLQKITNYQTPNPNPGHITDTSYEYFRGFDNTPNPLKGLCLWQDLLDRSLSTNNFTEYYDNEHPPVYPNTPSILWGLYYDANGRVNFSRTR